MAGQKHLKKTQILQKTNPLMLLQAPKAKTSDPTKNKSLDKSPQLLYYLNQKKKKKTEGKKRKKERRNPTNNSDELDGKIAKRTLHPKMGSFYPVFSPPSLFHNSSKM